MKSIEEKSQLSIQQVREILDSLSAINSKAIVLERDIQNVSGILASNDIMSQISSIVDDINNLAARNILSGGNITISDKQPSQVNNYDVWLDTSLIKV